MFTIDLIEETELRLETDSMLTSRLEFIFDSFEFLADISIASIFATSSRSSSFWILDLRKIISLVLSSISVFSGSIFQRVDPVVEF